MSILVPQSWKDFQANVTNVLKMRVTCRGIGSIKRLGGGRRFRGALLEWKGTWKKFPEMLATGGTAIIQNAIWTTFFTKAKGTLPTGQWAIFCVFEGKIIAIIKKCNLNNIFHEGKGHFATEKGHFLCFLKTWGEPSYAPWSLASNLVVIWAIWQSHWGTISTWEMRTIETRLL